MSLVPVVKGLISFIPGTKFLFSRKSQHSDSARYCYSVWLRHLVMAKKQGLVETPPEVVAELGPGDSLGTGIAALISGCAEYHAFDVFRFAGTEDNLRVFDELVLLFQEQAAIPDEVEFPVVGPRLETYAFPGDILNDDWLKVALDANRLQQIREAIQGMSLEGAQSKIISYVAPWSAMTDHQEGSVDMIFSQAVMEHVEEIEDSYRSMYGWLKDGGFISHQIDFKSHNTSDHWNGHWAYSNFLWACVKGTRKYFINRAPLSVHLAMAKKCNFEIVYSGIRTQENGISRDQLAREFASMSEEDFGASGVFLQAKKPVAIA